jgi:hypothetical protein
MSRVGPFTADIERFERSVKHWSCATFVFLPDLLLGVHAQTAIVALRHHLKGRGHTSRLAVGQRDEFSITRFRAGP